MQGQIRKLKSKIVCALLCVVGASLFVSCASQKDVALVKDPDEKADSMIPWNKQEKWETQSQLGGITDRR